MGLYEIVKQHGEEMLRQAEQERLAERLRSSRKPRVNRMPFLMWETERIVGRIRKFSRWSKRADRKPKG